MKSFFSSSLSSKALWELSYLLLAAYLLFHPALLYPQSTAVVLGGGLLLFLFRGIPKGSLEKLGLFWVLFLLYSILSAVWSLSPGLSLQASGFLFLGTLLFLMAQQSELASKDRIETFVLLLALIAAAIGIYQWLFGFAELSASTQLSGGDADIVAAGVHNKRAFGPLVTSGALAALLIFVIPQTAVRFSTASGSKKTIFALVNLVLLLGLAATGGVGAWVCLAVALAFLLYRQKGISSVLFLFGFFAVIVLALIWHRGLHSWTLASYSMRVELWHSAWQLFLQHPILGWGLGTFGEAYQSAGFALSTGALFTHNILLQLLVETGLVGTLLFGAALVSVIRRFQWPSRWEGWGVLGGTLAVLLFSLVDLPFQMAELVWVFAGVAGRLDLRADKPWKWPVIPTSCVPIALLIVFAVTGFFKPYAPWNFTVLAVALWVIFALVEGQLEELQWWVFLGSAFLAVRAFTSPSASGTVWFLELTALLVIFYRTLPKLSEFKKFTMFFAGLGLLWAVKLAWYCWHNAPDQPGDWFRFQLIDVEPWVFNPNPKQLAVFLIPLVFLLWQKKRSGLRALGLSLALLVVLRLKALGALVGLAAGWLWSLRTERKKLFIALVIAVAALVLFRSINSSSTKWERLDIWIAALRVWSQSPWVGVGPGVFDGAFHQVQLPRLDGVNRYLMDARYAHNEFLDLLTAFGLLGFTFVMALVWKTFTKIKDEQNKSAFLGLAAASFFDFCLHTPLVALLGVSTTAQEEKSAQHVSYSGVLLVLGLTLGLFGSAAFVPRLEQQAAQLVSANHYPEALSCSRQTVQLDAWNARALKSESDFYEQLYLATKDTTWKMKANESLNDAMGLEQADGNLPFEQARRYSRRFLLEPSQETFERAGAAWTAAEKAAPLNTFVTFEEGNFLAKAAQISRTDLWGKDGLGPLMARCYARSVDLEPNFAAAWVNWGQCLAQDADLQKSLTKEEKRVQFAKALEVYDRWKDAAGLSPVEKQMVDLPTQEVERLRQEVSR